MQHSDTILARLMTLHPKVIDLSLGRTVDLLDRLDRPQDRLPPVVHIAGTNGKGSTLATLRAIAEAAGLRVHAYSSPHLARFHERIRLAGSLIAEADLTALLEECEQVNGGRPITFFEITTCAAFKAFAETPADLLLLETGLGGRLDSTNVVDRPAATAITPISLDHVQFLGDTLAAIAGEKAAIQKPGVPSIVGPQPAEAFWVIDNVAAQVGAPLARHGVEWAVSYREDRSFRFESAALTIDLPPPNLPGAHQIFNAATAVALAAALRDQGLVLPDAVLRAGVQSVDWPARFQRLASGPIVDALPGWEVILDGGHNAAAGEVLAAELGRLSQDGVPVHAISGMLTSKAAVDFFAPLAGALTSLATVAIPGEENSFDPQELARIAMAAGVQNVSAEANVLQAARKCASQSAPARLLICGSLYLAGGILRDHA